MLVSLTTIRSYAGGSNGVLSEPYLADFQQMDDAVPHSCVTFIHDLETRNSFWDQFQCSSVAVV